MTYNTLRAAIINGNGLNCERETAYAFSSVGLATDILLFKKILLNPSILRNYRLLVVPGGFSYGDNTGAGNAIGVMIKHFLKDEIDRFLNNGNILIGICNGCQALINGGLILNDIALNTNAGGKYECRWVYVRAPKKSIWFEKDEILKIPVAHKEGNFTTNRDITGNIALRYCDTNGNYAEGRYPVNPNGSVSDIAAITNEAGNALAVMPHPERSVLFSQYPDFTSMKYNNTSYSRHNFFQRVVKALNCA